MTWTDDDWQIFVALMRRAWPGEFTEDDRRAYRTLLDPEEPAAVVEALRRLLYGGARFRPSVAELLAEVRHDPSRPTFVDAYALLFGAGGVLRVPPVRGAFPTPAAMEAAQDAAVLERAATLHPLLTSFIERQSIGRLRQLRLDDPDWGPKYRADLEREWREHVEAMEGREVAAIAAGSGRSGLRQLDPLAALGMPRPTEIPLTATREGLAGDERG